MTALSRTEREPALRERPFPDSHDVTQVRGARENNLRNISVDIPKRRLTVFTGVSGPANPASSSPAPSPTSSLLAPR